MSSTTLPTKKPRKRQFDQVVTPEFPALPITLSLQAAIEFAGKSQVALDTLFPTTTTSNTISNTNQDSLFLPLISPHQLQSRFKVKDNSVFVMTRKSYSHLKREVDSFALEEFRGVYVRGPVGIGKSYLLYMLAVDYRLNRGSYRVTYINDCATWRRRPYPYLLAELVTSFYNDTIETKSIIEWCQAVTGSDKEQKMMMMMESLINYTRVNNLIWIIICDQHNALFNPPVVKNFPFNHIDMLADNRGSNIKIIVSASANNEGYPTEMKGWHSHNISSRRFDQEEFRVWCDHYLLANDIKVDHESEEAMDALYWTGGVPYELDFLWKQPYCISFSEKTISYRKERTADMMESHAKFCDKLSEERKRNLKECISRMALELSPPEGLIGMDRQLFDIMEDGDAGNDIITVLNPVARQALILFHGKSFVTSLALVAENVLKGTDYNNSMKGKISEMYVTTMLEVLKLFNFQFRKAVDISKIGLSNDDPVRRNIEIKSVVHFFSNKLPPKTSFHKNNTTLFVPESPNYPEFDFFLWDSTRQLLMGFQVTVCNPFSRHPKMTNSQIWQQFCFGDSDEQPPSPMEMYWVVPKCCVGKDHESVVNDFIILFEDLINDFPALGKLILQ
jgi:hypothetical protein